jgi:hypothetical protein
MYEGKIVGIIPRDAVDIQQLGAMMAGAGDNQSIEEIQQVKVE